ncbi:MAG TPA: hypothetical protein VF170_18275 [Planctomycetaceae bacterium]
MSELNERARRQIALLAGDDLEGEPAEEARRSIGACPECRRHWVRVRGCLDVLERVAKAAEPVPGPSLWPALESRLRPAVTVRRAERFNGWVPALSMAAACIALLIAGQMDGVPAQDSAVADQEALAGAMQVNWPPLEGFDGFERDASGAILLPQFVPPGELRDGSMDGLLITTPPQSIRSGVLSSGPWPFFDRLR